MKRPPIPEDTFHKINDLIYHKYPNKYASKQSLILEILYILQDANKGFLSPECMHYAAMILDMSYGSVVEIASFYTMFNLEPIGKFHIKICETIPCHLFGVTSLKQMISKCVDLINKKHEKQYFTLSNTECLGACTDGPVMTINDCRYKIPSTPDKIYELLDSMITDS